jgi:hypothetical protein
MLFRRANPYNTINPSYTPLTYIVRHVRGGRSPEGVVRFSWTATAIMAAVIVLPLGLFLLAIGRPFSVDRYYYLENTFYYALGVMGISIILFPIVDFFTLLYAVVSVRGDMNRSIKFDLLRTSLANPADYVDSRIALAKVRAWRVFVFMWTGRLLACVLVALLGVIAFIMEMFVNPLNWRDFTYSDTWFGLAVAVICGAIFLTQLLAEPLWRLDMLIAFGVSIATRVRRGGALMWLVLGLGTLGLIVAQGAIGAAVVFFGFRFAENISDLLWASDQDFTWQFRERIGFLTGVLPYAFMPLAVWAFHRMIRRWRRRVAIHYIFRYPGGDN